MRRVHIIRVSRDAARPRHFGLLVNRCAAFRPRPVVGAADGGAQPAAAAGLALIDSVGNLGGFVGPYATGLVRSWTASFSGGLYLIAGALACAAVVALLVRHDPAIE